MAVVISIAAVFICYQFEIFFNVDLTLLSIAIIFPLVFTIRGSFRRREKALEHLSQYRSALKTLYYFVTTSNLLEQEETALKLSQQVVRPMGKLYVRYPNLDFIYYMFRYRYLAVPKVKCPKIEVAQSKWVTPEQAYQLPLIAGGKEALDQFKAVSLT